MSDTSVLPASLAVRNTLEDLLGRDVNVSPGDPMTADDLPLGTIAIYTDSSQKIYAVMGMQLSLAANMGAAVGLLPAGAAEDAIDEKTLFPNLKENLGECFNVLKGLVSKESSIKLYQVIYPGMDLPNDARAHFLALGKRLDLTVEIARYGKGKFSLSMA